MPPGHGKKKREKEWLSWKITDSSFSICSRLQQSHSQLASIWNGYAVSVSSAELWLLNNTGCLCFIDATERCGALGAGQRQSLPRKRMPNFLCGCWGFELRSSCLNGSTLPTEPFLPDLYSSLRSLIQVHSLSPNIHFGAMNFHLSWSGIPQALNMLF